MSVGHHFIVWSFVLFLRNILKPEICQSEANTIYPLSVCHTFTDVEILQIEAQGLRELIKITKASVLIA